MKAMVLAAGLGTRLQPLTNDRPKALVQIAGRTLLEITLRRLQSFGIEDVIVNVHHFADLVVECLKARDNFGMNIEVSREDELLDTGGGLKKAAHFFLGDAGDEPFVVHNVDVLSSIDLAKMLEFHRSHDALATLAVQRRKSSRLLLFDDNQQLSGRITQGADEGELVRQAEKVEALAFCGVHVLSPRIFSKMHEEGAFPVVPAYLRLAGEGEKVLGFSADSYYWRDLGRHSSLQQAEEDLAEKVIEQ